MARNVLALAMVMAMAAVAQAAVVVEDFEGDPELADVGSLVRSWGSWSTSTGPSRVITRTAGEEAATPDGDPPDKDAQMHPSSGVNIAIMNFTEADPYSSVQYSFQLHSNLGSNQWFQVGLNQPWDTQGNQQRRMGVWWNNNELTYWHDPNTTKVADVPLPGSEGLWVHVKLEFNDAGGDGTQESVDVLYKTADQAAWTLGLDDAPTPGNWDNVVGFVTIEAQGNNNDGLMHFDNVILVPEPATLSVIGLGALALMRRRKA